MRRFGNHSPLYSSAVMSSHSGGLGVKELMWVFVADPPLIDNAIYAMWVDGLAGTPISALLFQLFHI